MPDLVRLPALAVACRGTIQETKARAPSRHRVSGQRPYFNSSRPAFCEQPNQEVKRSRRKLIYTDEFKTTAVVMDQQGGVKVKPVPGGLDIHPFMLLRWMKECLDGKLVSSPWWQLVTKHTEEEVVSEATELEQLRLSGERLVEKLVVRRLGKKTCPVSISFRRT